MKEYERSLDIIKLVERLDITPTMYQNAVEKYNSIASYLEANGLEADIYPQGSFALGTVVKPSVKDADAAYDLDAICQIHGSRDNLTPKQVWDKVGSILSESDLYGGKLETFDKCYTIHYADVDGYGFSIDVVPATAESTNTIARWRFTGPNQHLVDSAIVIPQHNDTSLTWACGNPKGYQAWFKQANAPFADVGWSSYRNQLFNKNRKVYASVEQVPQNLNRSSVQRVIQILKYHRDVYFSHIKDGDALKPKSIIISTLSASLAKALPASSGILDVLNYVTKELSIYEKKGFLTPHEFQSQYGIKDLIVYNDGVWTLRNPANPNDNLADSWNSEPACVKYFFVWAKQVRSDLIESMELPDPQFRTAIESAFGYNAVSKAWGPRQFAEPAKSIQSDTPAKPWRAR